MTENTGMIITASGRTLEEMKASCRIRMRNMVTDGLALGHDLIETKEACKHGEWLPFLKEIGLSASSANNYMRVAKEVDADARLAELPYTKILALMAAPKDDREELTEMAGDLSAAEIRRLTKERNAAAEAANSETARADQAEADAKMFNQENANLRNQVNVLQNELNKQAQYNEDLRGKLLEAENNRVEVEKRVEVVPKDYETLKRQQAELIEAAAAAEERAAQAEAELEEVRSENARNGASEYEKMHLALKTFMMQCEPMAIRPEGLYRDAAKVRNDVMWLKQWCETISEAMETQILHDQWCGGSVDGLHVVEGAVV